MSMVSRSVGLYQRINILTYRKGKSIRQYFFNQTVSNAVQSANKKMKTFFKKIALRIYGFFMGVFGQKCPYVYDGQWYAPVYLGGKCEENDWCLASRAWKVGRYFGRLRAPITWRIGCTSHKGETMVVSPIFTRISIQTTRWVAWRVIIRQDLKSNEIQDISQDLFGEWWYQSGAPDFGWISWAISLRRAMQAMPANRHEARHQSARVN